MIRPSRRRRVRLAVSTLAAIGAALTIVSAGTAAKPKPLPQGPISVQHPAFVPLGLSRKPETVVLQVAGDPVTVAAANSATPLTKDQKRQLKAQLRAKQKGIEQQVEAAGGTVVGDYQSAYNGIKVVVPRGKAKALASIQGVVAVHPVRPMTLSNIHGVPLIGAPEVWGGTASLHGEGIKVAVIDTGIDYTHADFGGSGNPADYQSALASDTLPANAAWFGPGAPRVKGGIDLVGDDYNPDPSDPAFQPVPHPDPNPLDCNGHGSHTSGTAAGSGVLSDGSTFPGPYDSTTVSSNSWNVGPGVAPKADIYSVKIFGCNGPTNETLEAIEWAVDNDMDVINMSLGTEFGSPDNPESVAATNAAKDGVIVVASSGNEGSNPYMTESPASGYGAISVAANDGTESFPGANVALSTGPSVLAINANGATFSDGTVLPVKVLFSAPGVVSLGCNPAEYTGVAGTLVVTRRGDCARVARAVFGQQAGAAAVLMINNSTTLPPFEGHITGNPDTGEQYDVTIPFLGARSSATSALVAADGGMATLSNLTIPNPGFQLLGDFSSFGPASGDSSVKPNVTAPGVSIFSAGMGSGIGAAVLSGTSMAAPHTAGLAALVRQAHPSWKKVKYWAAAVENTADPGGVADYLTQGAGTGFIQAPPATRTDVVALGTKDAGVLSFGFAELKKDYSEQREITLKNLGDSPATFTVSDTLQQGSPHSTSFNKLVVTVPAHGDRDIRVRLTVPANTAGGAVVPCGGVSCAFSPISQAAGVVRFTPTSGNNGVTLRVPYLLAPQEISQIIVKKQGQAAAKITNKGPASGAADWYQWGIKDGKNKGVGSNDILGVGVQSFPGAEVLAFAIGTRHRWSNASEDEFDIYVDVNNDGVDDYVVVAADLGAITAGEFNGVTAVAVFDLSSGGGSIEFLADAPVDSSTMTLPVSFEQLQNSNPATSLGGANQRFTYRIVSFGLTDNTVDEGDKTAKFNPFTPAVNTGMFDVVPPGGTVTEALTVNAAEQALSPARGWMIVSHENGEKDEASFLDLK